MEKEYMIIDGIPVELEGEKNILDVIRKAGIELPTFCYYSDLSVYGACRMCVVEDNRGGIMASCSTPPKSGMVIKTNTKRLREHRKLILELLLANHCRDCTTCDKSGKCRLQELALRFGIREVRFENRATEPDIDDSSRAIVRDRSKCILCGDCVRVCSEIQNVGAIDFAGRGSGMKVSTAFDVPLAQTGCVNCGQCAAVCPTGAIVVKNDVPRVWDAIHDPDVRVVAQVAPAVRVAIGEEFGLGRGQDCMGKVTAALRRIGFDEVFDTATGADLTVAEESSELLERLESGENLPLFTSCCPAWVEYVRQHNPELIGNVSSCKSPMAMFAAVLRAHYQALDVEDPKKTFHVAVMPCTAKKYEAALPQLSQDGEPDVDCVITTQGLVQMIREAGIQFASLEPEGLDMPFGMASGAGVIFGVTGGVTEAVARRLAGGKGAASLRSIAFTGVRGFEGLKETQIDVGGRTVRIAVVSGLKNAADLIARIRSGEAQYDFVEVMACPAGCIAGAGQPFGIGRHRRDRSSALYASDKQSVIRHSDENPVIEALYSGLLREHVHELLHTDHGCPARA